MPWPPPESLANAWREAVERTRVVNSSAFPGEAPYEHSFAEGEDEGEEEEEVSYSFELCEEWVERFALTDYRRSQSATPVTLFATTLFSRLHAQAGLMQRANLQRQVKQCLS